MNGIPGTQHRISQASAGTGKTTWITRQAVNLLTAKTPLDGILFMTFTERATGDLKARLRQAVQEACKNGHEHRDLLQTALDGFDQAQVYTIHGFCRRVLADHPFETGFDFRPALAADRPLLKSCLRELQRTRWRTEHGEHLRDFLARLGYEDLDNRWDRWESRVVEVAGAFRAACRYLLRPEYANPDPASLNGTSLPPTADQLAVETVRQLQELLAAHKKERGLFSFEDMLTRVARALDPKNPRASLLLAALRRRYRIAIIDEFQDTDPLQWSIFKRIFVEDGSPQRLCVVGDPKQAIFGFLGADVHAYLDAIRELKTCPDTADPEQLAVNWRTCADLLRPLNELFDKGKWFAESEIDYVPLVATDPPVHHLIRDRSERAALTLVDLRPEDKLERARWIYARFVAAEIDRLLHGGDAGLPLLEIQKKEDSQPRPLRGSDISILIRKRGEARPLLCCLRERGIACSLYKQQGLRDSEEAEQLTLLLKALARPDEASALRKALLTMFFQVRPEELAAREELPENLPAVRRFRRWCDLARRRRWGELFHSLLEDSRVLLADLGDTGYERRLANLRHLFGVLEQAGYGRGLDLLGLIAELEQPQPGDDQNDNDCQPIETERSKVRIMTIHAAKGDEYPVVFVAGGYTMSRQERSPAWYRYRDNGTLVFHLQTKENAVAQAQHEKEVAAEDKRLLYVTLTRPMFKLYLPRLNPDGYKGGWCGSLVKILVPALETAKLESLGHPYVQLLDPLSVSGKHNSSTAQETKPFGPSTLGEADQGMALPEELFPNIPVSSLQQRGIRVRSYSTLRKAYVPAAQATFSDRPAREEEEPAEQPDDAGMLRGTLFGELVHEALQQIDFAAVTAAAEPRALLAAGPVRALLEQVLQAHAAALPASAGADREAALLQVARVIWFALRTRLEPLGCCMGDIPRQDRLHELEFHFPERLAGHPASLTEGFFTGFMDSVFRRGGRYYLLDWKTNDLGGDYSPAALARCMEESDYRRQYRLYLVALCRWLQKRVPGFDFGRHFGGVYYLFLRGMNGRDQSGVFYWPGAVSDLDLKQILISAK